MKFGLKRIDVYPVVHVRSPGQAVEQTRLALSANADGVYLIHHGGSNSDLLAAYRSVRDAVGPLAFVGLNFLSCPTAADSLRLLSAAVAQGSIPDLPSGLWVDDARPSSGEAAALRRQQQGLAEIRYLGGTSFKYTSAYSDEPAPAAAEARAMAPVVDVVCTSGPGTGRAPTADKITAMKAAIGDQPLAIASGVDHRNLDLYRHAVDEVLVATSIETEPYSGVFESKELRRLIAVCHGDAASSES